MWLTSFRLSNGLPIDIDAYIMKRCISFLNYQWILSFSNDMKSQMDLNTQSRITEILKLVYKYENAQ